VCCWKITSFLQKADACSNQFCTIFLSAFVKKILIFSNIVLSTTLGTMTVFIGIFSGDFVSGFLRVLDCFYPLKYYFHPLLFRMLGRPHSCCEHGGKGKYL
jgi:hypothetical protein